MSEKTNIALLAQLGQRLRSRRKILRLKQQDVADMCGVQRQTIGRLERGGPAVAIETLVSVASVLGLNVVAIPSAPSVETD